MIKNFVFVFFFQSSAETSNDERIKLITSSRVLVISTADFTSCSFDEPNTERLPRRIDVNWSFEKASNM